LSKDQPPKSVHFIRQSKTSRRLILRQAQDDGTGKDSVYLNRKRSDLKLNYVRSFQSLIGLGDFEFDAIAFVESFEAFSANRGKVNKNILATFILGNKAEALFIIEPLDYTLSHKTFSPDDGMEQNNEPICPMVPIARDMNLD
jgi:hypothetical protein